MWKRPAVTAILGAVLGTVLGAVFAIAAAGAEDGAANFPDHPIRIVVSVPAGGGVDTVTRIVADRMRVTLGQPLAVENKSGAGGSVAADAVFHSDPDGYTLMASQPAPITTNPFLYKSLNYDPTKLTPVAIMSHIANVLFVRADLSAKTVADLIAYAKTNPGKLNYASQGIGTTSHLTAELFQTLTHTKLVHVPYKGTAPALNDLLAGNVDLMFGELATSLELHKAGKLRILAILTKERVAALPDVPTIAEAGVPGCESDTWNALTAPPQTPEGVVAKLNDAANKAMHDPELLDRFAKLDLSPGGGTPAEMSAFLKEETQRWGEVIRAAGIQPQ
ncbi:MAG TPA: tripartite tricarboxylate transporter substrate binding protein [Xanthobacteraceae bacterium]|nr:tripartite tricarboxylate transporter substrate binding protein [Xanthobacteraceae bacterium]